jgi:predicted tellurium resistance membrane protein TerC
MGWLTDPQIWASFAALAALEIVLGIDNLVFIAILANRVAPARRRSARRVGLALALFTRLALLGTISTVAHLTNPVFAVAGHPVSWRDIILIAGGAFLIFKGTREIHHRLEAGNDTGAAPSESASFGGTIAQIVAFDILFSLDSVITAVGIAEHLWVMVAAIVAAMAIMLAASDPLAWFIERHASVKMLALAFLLLIGMALAADGIGFHVPRGYIYAAMGFAGLVEALNLLAGRGKTRPEVHPAGSTAPPEPTPRKMAQKRTG